MRAFPNAEVLVKVAEEVGPIIKAGFLAQLQRKEDGSSIQEGVDWKKDNTPVTRTDKRVNNMVVERISAVCPWVSILGEEDEEREHRQRYSDDSDVIVGTDPLDGTLQFIAGRAVATFCIWTIQGTQVVSAVIHDPFFNRTWAADAGKGCFLNGKPVRVSEKSIDRSFVSVMWWSEAVMKLGHVCDRIDESGGHWNNTCAVGISLALVADGGQDGSVFGGKEVYETPSGVLLVREAGGVATDLDGNNPKFGWNPDRPGKMREQNGHVITNGKIQDDLLKFVHEAKSLQTGLTFAEDRLPVGKK